MQNNSLKKTTRFLGGAKLTCLAGRFQPASLATIKTPVVELKVPKVGCKVFLVGGDGVNPSDWHHTTVERFEKGSLDLEKLKIALEDHVGRIMTPSERRQSGLKPAAELTVADVVMDTTKRLVFLSFAINERDIDEHGLVAVHENSAWRMEDAGYVSNYIHNVVASGGDSDSAPVSLIGTWSFDERASVDLFKEEGVSDKSIREMVNGLRGTKWIITESKLVQKHPVHSRDYKLVSIEMKRSICLITVEITGLATPEVWKVKVKDDRIFGVCVMKREKDV